MWATIGGYADLAGIAPIIASPNNLPELGSMEVGRASVFWMRKITFQKDYYFTPKWLPAMWYSESWINFGLPTTYHCLDRVDALVHCYWGYALPDFIQWPKVLLSKPSGIIAKYLPIAVKGRKKIGGSWTNVWFAALWEQRPFKKDWAPCIPFGPSIGEPYTINNHGLLNAIILPYALTEQAAIWRLEWFALSKVLGFGNKSRYRMLLSII